MPNNLFESVSGFSVFNQAGFISGVGVPGGDGAIQDSMMIGSLYFRTDTGKQYAKIANANAQTDWVIMPIPDSTGTTAFLGDITAVNKNIYARHLFFGPLGGIHLQDINSSSVVEVMNIQAASQPADFINFFVGQLSPSILAFNIDVSNGQTTYASSIEFDAGIIHGNILRPSLASGTQNNWSPSGLVTGSNTTANTLFLTLTGNATLTGLSAQQIDGTVLYFYNKSAFTLTLSTDGFNQSSAANRFNIPNNVIIAQYEGFVCIYDAIASRWNIMLIDSSTDVQVFTSGTGTWTKPLRAKMVDVYCMGGGGGGGGGAKAASTTLRRGGGGGGGGGVSRAMFRPASLPGTVTVTVGGAGLGGNGTTVNGNGSSGGNGGDSTFGSYLLAGGGLAGAGGTSSPIDASLVNTAYGNISTGALNIYSPISSNGSTVSSGPQLYAGSAGGSGASMIATTGAAGVGGNGSGPAFCIPSSITAAVGGNGSSTATAAGVGGNGNTFVTDQPGTSGAGGGSNSSSGNGGAGGVGGAGCGGGGGGAATTGSTSGKGGNGGNGIVIVTTYR